MGRPRKIKTGEIIKTEEIQVEMPVPEMDIKEVSVGSPIAEIHVLADKINEIIRAINQ